MLDPAPHVASPTFGCLQIGCFGSNPPQPPLMKLSTAGRPNEPKPTEKRAYAPTALPMACGGRNIMSSEGYHKDRPTAVYTKEVMQDGVGVGRGRPRSDRKYLGRYGIGAGCGWPRPGWGQGGVEEGRAGSWMNWDTVCAGW